tara:strand:- start:458 stop:907 length:450 start_codon:yes stop_codon:yes gene_type:complete
LSVRVKTEHREGKIWHADLTGAEFQNQRGINRRAHAQRRQLTLKFLVKFQSARNLLILNLVAVPLLMTTPSMFGIIFLKDQGESKFAGPTTKSGRNRRRTMRPSGLEKPKTHSDSALFILEAQTLVTALAALSSLQAVASIALHAYANL